MWINGVKVQHRIMREKKIQESGAKCMVDVKLTLTVTL